MLFRYALLPIAVLPIFHASSVPRVEECVCGDVCPCHAREESTPNRRTTRPQSAWVGLERVLEKIEGLRKDGFTCEPIRIESSTQNAKDRGERVTVEIDLVYPAENTLAGTRAHEELVKALRSWLALESMGGYSSEPLPEGKGLRVTGTKLVLDLAGKVGRRIPAESALEPDRLMSTIRATADQMSPCFPELILKLVRRELRGGTEYRVHLVPANPKQDCTWKQLTDFLESLERRHPELAVTMLKLSPRDEACTAWKFVAEVTMREEVD